MPPTLPYFGEEEAAALPDFGEEPKLPDFIGDDERARKIAQFKSEQELRSTPTDSAFTTGLLDFIGSIPPETLPTGQNIFNAPARIVNAIAGKPVIAEFHGSDLSGLVQQPLEVAGELASSVGILPRGALTSQNNPLVGMAQGAEEIASGFTHPDVLSTLPAFASGITPTVAGIATLARGKMAYDAISSIPESVRHSIDTSLNPNSTVADVFKAATEAGVGVGIAWQMAKAVAPKGAKLPERIEPSALDRAAVKNLALPARPAPEPMLPELQRTRDLVDLAIKQNSPGYIWKQGEQSAFDALKAQGVEITPREIATAERIQGGGEAPYGKVSFQREAEAPTTRGAQELSASEKQSLSDFLTEEASQGAVFSKQSLPPGVSYRRPSNAPTQAEYQKRLARESVEKGMEQESGYYLDEPRTESLPEPTPQPERVREGGAIIEMGTGRALEKPIPLSNLQRSRLRVALSRGASEQTIINILRLEERQPSQPQRRKGGQNPPPLDETLPPESGGKPPSNPRPINDPFTPTTETKNVPAGKQDAAAMTPANPPTPEQSISFKESEKIGVEEAKSIPGMNVIEVDGGGIALNPSVKSNYFPPNAIHIEGLYSERRGAGTELMVKAAEFAVKSGKPLVWSKPNPGAEGFYLKLGFKPVDSVGNFMVSVGELQSFLKRHKSRETQPLVSSPESKAVEPSPKPLNPGGAPSGNRLAELQRLKNAGLLVGKLKREYDAAMAASAESNKAAGDKMAAELEARKAKESTQNITVDIGQAKGDKGGMTGATVERAIEIEKEFGLDAADAHFFNVAIEAVKASPEKWTTLAEGIQKEAMRASVAAQGSLKKTGDLSLSKRIAEKYLEPKSRTTKEPWEMTIREIKKSIEIDRAYDRISLKGREDATTVGQDSLHRNADNDTVARDFHKMWIRSALREGKPVPPEVLKDYPDLQPKPTAPEVKAEPTPPAVEAVSKKGEGEIPKSEIEAFHIHDWLGGETYKGIPRRVDSYQPGHISWGKDPKRGHAIQNARSKKQRTANSEYFNSEVLPKIIDQLSPKQLFEIAQETGSEIALKKSGYQLWRKGDKQQWIAKGDALEQQAKDIGASVVEGAKWGDKSPTALPDVYSMSRKQMIDELSSYGITETFTGGYVKNSTAADLQGMVLQARKKSAPTPTTLERADAKLAELQKKIRGSGANLQMGVPKAVLDLSIEVARVSLRATNSVIKAVEAAIEYIKREHPNVKFNKDELSEWLASHINKATEDVRVPSTAGEQIKMRRSAARATESPMIPKPVQEKITQAPESYYKVQPGVKVEEAVKGMSDAELVAIPSNSNLFVASRIEAADRLFKSGKMDEGYNVFVELEKQGTSFGQNINQFKRLPGTLPEHVAFVLNQKLKKEGKDPLTKAQQDKVIDISTRSKKADGELAAATDRWVKEPTDKNAKAAEDALNNANDTAVELQRFASKFTPRSTSALLKSVLQGNLLTPISEVANLVGNMSFLPFRAADRGIATGLDILSNKIMGSRRTVSVGPVSGTAEAAKGAIRGLKQVPDVVKYGTGDVIKGETRAGLHPIRAWINQFAKNPEMPTTGGKITLQDRVNLAIEGTLGVPAEVMLRGLGAGDIPFKEAARGRVIAEQLRLHKIPKDKWAMAQRFPELFFDRETRELIRSKTMEAIFQRDSKTLNVITNWIRGRGDMFDLAVATVAPYKLTPWNIVGEILSYNPLVAFGRSVYESRKGNARSARLNAGKFVVGTMLSTAGWWLYKQGLLAPSLDARDEAQKARLLAGEVLPPNHINISGLKRAMSGGDPEFKAGDETVDIFRAGGLAGSMFYMAANVGRDLEKQPESGTVDTLAALLSQSTLEQARFGLNQSFLSGVEGFLTAVKDGNTDNYLRQWMNTVSSIPLPNSLSTLSRATRKYKPDFSEKGFKSQAENIVRMKLGFAGLDDEMPLKRGLWGEPIPETPQGKSAIIYHFFDVSKNKQVTDDPVALELFRLWRTTGDTAVIPSLPMKTFTMEGTTYMLNTEQYEKLSEFVGKYRREIVDGYATNPNFYKLDDDEKIEFLEDAYRQGLKEGKEDFFDEHEDELKEKPKKAGFKQ